MSANVGDARIDAVNPYMGEQRKQTDLLKSIRNGVSLIAVMLLVFSVVLILAIIGASA